MADDGSLKRKRADEVEATLQETSNTPETCQVKFQLKISRELMSTEAVTSSTFSAFGLSWSVQWNLTERSKDDSQLVLAAWLYFVPSEAAPLPNFSVKYAMFFGPKDDGCWWVRDSSKTKGGSGSGVAQCPALADIDKPDSDLLNEQKQLLLGIALRVQLPPFAMQGPLTLQLDCGRQLKAHSMLLEYRSSVLAEALCMASSTAEGTTPIKVPCVTALQACLLLQAIYSPRSETWCSTLTFEHTIELAKVAHRLNCDSVLQLADDALVVKCAAAAHPDVLVKPGTQTCLKAADVTQRYWLAHRLGLSEFGQECAAFMVKNLKSLPDTDKDGLAPLLKQLKK